ncbi:uncharacterized protein LOC8276335 isoform X1 [Ricinus communis]|uniref:uncharacterized protein LOC8276335 isoform X1 n=1 Tax=Ricinus communis TaxID=3988 RepID=UPI00201B21E7|nr:uncharacterized protein LOC8276335 isoform X1 [Ricinus communis]
MSFSLKFTYSTPLLQHHGFNKLRCTFISRFPRHYYLQKCQNSSLNQNHTRRLCSTNGESNARLIQITLILTLKVQEKNMTPVKHHSRPARTYCLPSLMLKKLKRYGVSGILSYGLLNTAYYLTTFLLVWFYVAPAPGKMGYFAAVERFLKVMAMVWAGSQVTKLIRAGGAVALAPFVDRGLSWFTLKFKFESQGKAFMAIVGFCLGLAFILFLVVTLLWA